jgi:hypothetical protein
LPENKRRVAAKKALAKVAGEVAPTDPREKLAALKDEVRERAKNSYYGQLKRRDTLTMLKPVITASGWKLRFGDGKADPEYSIPAYAPWHYVRHLKRADCFMSHHILFNVVAKQTSRPFVPSFCHHCWKVVVRPKSLAGLFALLDIQKNHPDLEQYACKCGIERRPTVFGAYGGYFYNTSFEAGMQCYKTVRRVVDETDRLGEETPVIYKRACTEYELAIGPSHLWEPPTPEQLEVEENIANTIVREAPTQPTMPQHVIDNVHRNWIEFAFFVGDPTYLEYTGGIPLVRPYVTYHDRDPWKEEHIDLQAVLTWDEIDRRGMLDEKAYTDWKEATDPYRHQMGE